MLFHRYQSEAKRQRERRLKLKEGISKVCEENKEAASLLRSFSRKEHGRPRIEYDQPELLSTIVKIVEASSATDDRRRMKCLRTVTILDDLHSELENLGFSLSRSATYLRLLPRRGNTSEGYRHVQTVPVKLTRPENNLRKKKNKDRMFAKSFMDDLINVCKFFGPQSVHFSRMKSKGASASVPSSCVPSSTNSYAYGVQGQTS